MVSGSGLLGRADLHDCWANASCGAHCLGDASGDAPCRRQGRTIPPDSGRDAEMAVSHRPAEAPVAVQSMTTTFTQDVAATVRQIKALERAGCEIVRVAIPDTEAASAILSIKAQVSIPIEEVVNNIKSQLSINKTKIKS